MIRKDIKFLEQEKARRPTQSFLNAKDAFDEIQKKMNSYLCYSVNVKLISSSHQEIDIRKDINFLEKKSYEEILRSFNKLKEVDRQLYANSSSSGCFSVIAGAAIIFLLTRVIF